MIMCRLLFFVCFGIIWGILAVENPQKNSRKSSERYSSCGTISNYISGDNEVKRGQFPWMVAIFQKQQNNVPTYICGGTLVDTNKVVTAAHCVHNKNQLTPTHAKDLILLFGAFDLNERSEMGRLYLHPSQLIIHEGWNSHVDRFNDDIAILMLDREITFTEFIQPICLFEPHPGDVKPDHGIVAGWGRTQDSTEIKRLPKKVEIPIAESNEKCFLKNYVFAIIGSEKSFCAGEPGVGVCRGDSGSGFFVRRINNKFYLKGVVSSSLISATGCYSEDYAIYMDVYKYYKFINTLKEPSKKTCGIMSSATSLVVGGTVSTKLHFPWTVSVWVKMPEGNAKLTGTGSLISNLYVVTAASSVTDQSYDRYLFAYNPKLVSVRFGGAESIGSDIERIGFYATMASFKSPLAFNVAVCTMSGLVGFSETIFPICLPSSDFSVEDVVGETAYGVGYGKDETGGNTGTKKHVPMTIESMERCRSVWGEEMKKSGSSWFCARGQAGQIVSDNDDPIYIKKNDRWILIGASNFHKVFDSDSAANFEASVLYENTAKLVTWIKNQMELVG